MNQSNIAALILVLTTSILVMIFYKYFCARRERLRNEFYLKFDKAPPEYKRAVDDLFFSSLLFKKTSTSNFHTYNNIAINDYQCYVYSPNGGFHIRGSIFTTKIGYTGTFHIKIKASNFWEFKESEFDYTDVFNCNFNTTHHLHIYKKTDSTLNCNILKAILDCSYSDGINVSVSDGFLFVYKNPSIFRNKYAQIDNYKIIASQIDRLKTIIENKN